MTDKLKSLEELGSALKKPSYSKAPMIECEPISLRRLVEIIGNQTEAGRLIGVSANHISGCLTNNKIRLSYELAAKAVLMEMQRETTRPARYLIEVPSDKKEILSTFLSALKIKATEI